MPERLDRVAVRTQNGDVTISWESRRVLLSLLAQEENTTEIRSSFEAVGDSHPVELSAEQRATLTDLLDEWLMDDDLFPEGTKRGLIELDIALNMGEPLADYVEALAEAEAEEEPGSRSQNWQWEWTRWRDREDPGDDHQHCWFCRTNIEDDAVTQAWRTFGDGDYERWVCAGCFEKLKERFGWTGTSPSRKPSQRLA
jgi:hypothetical protein